MAAVDLSTLKHAVRSFSTVPRLHYASRALRIYSLLISDNYPKEWRADQAELLGDGERYEALFSGSRDAFERVVTPYEEEFGWPLGRVYNSSFQTIDIEVYHSVIRTYRPRLIVEVGCGHSTRFALEALERNGEGRLICIDPDPYFRLPKKAVHIRSIIEDVDLGVFDQLDENDILFIDSSHTTAEAQYHVDQVLPRLRPGVLIHHHDILFPFQTAWEADEAMGEQRVALDFYSRSRAEYQILLGSAYLVAHHPHLVRRLVPSYRWAPIVLGSSLWAQKRPTV